MLKKREKKLKKMLEDKQNFKKHRMQLLENNWNFFSRRRPYKRSSIVPTPLLLKKKKIGLNKN